MKRKHIVVVTLIVWTLASTALALNGVHRDEFGIVLEGYNVLIEGWGTGWNGGEWNLYDQAPTVPSAWWNQWFYDDPPDDARMKHIEYGFTVIPSQSIDAAVSTYNINVAVALNWSNMGYPETGPDGSPPMATQEQYIEREIVLYDDDFLPNMAYEYLGEYDIPDYNPEWVSIDVWVEARGWNTWTDPATGMTYTEEFLLPVEVSGWIEHVCLIPEPSTMILLGFGALALLKKT
ncbi:MAG: PEP-CTERM sorting domain-containing protein [Planctomycetota bacterium]